MKKATKNILAVFGVTSAVVGLSGAIPFWAAGKYGLAITSSGFIFIGLMLLALAFGD